MHGSEPTERAFDTDPSSPMLNYMQLRAVAEWASGYRGERFWLVVRPHPDNGDIVMERHPEHPGEVPGAVVIPCHTPDLTKRTRVVSAEIRPHDGERLNLLELTGPDGLPLGPADAVFWSQSAVEKFAVPYYASVGGERAGEVVTRLLNLFEGIHSEDPASEGEAEEHTHVYALVHMPKSEYVEEPGGEPTSGEGLGPGLFAEPRPTPGAELERRRVGDLRLTPGAALGVVTYDAATGRSLVRRLLDLKLPHRDTTP